MEKRRIVWVDIAKFICIMFVMLSHLESSTAPLDAFFSPFFLTLFFFCSGYVYKSGDSFQKFLVKKTKQLLIPWLFFSTANILLAQIISFNEHRPLGEELFWNFMQIRGLEDGLWFLSALFMAFIPFFFFIRWYQGKPFSTKRVCLLMAVGFALAFVSDLYCALIDPDLLPWGSYALPWHLEYIFVAQFYMLMGYLFRQSFEKAFDDRNTAAFRILVWAAYLIVVCIESFYSGSNVLIPILLGYLSSILGIGAVISLCKRMKPNRYITFIGQNSLLCFALHGKVYSLLQTVLKKLAGDLYFAILDHTLASSVLAFLLTFVMSVILILPIYIINRYFPFLIGRSRQKSAK